MIINNIDKGRHFIGFAAECLMQAITYLRITTVRTSEFCICFVDCYLPNQKQKLRTQGNAIVLLAFPLVDLRSESDCAHDTFIWLGNERFKLLFIHILYNFKFSHQVSKFT